MIGGGRSVITPMRAVIGHTAKVIACGAHPFELTARVIAGGVQSIGRGPRAIGPASASIACGAGTIGHISTVIVLSCGVTGRGPSMIGHTFDVIGHAAEVITGGGQSMALKLRCAGAELGCILVLMHNGHDFPLP